MAVWRMAEKKKIRLKANSTPAGADANRIRHVTRRRETARTTSMKPVDSQSRQKANATGWTWTILTIVFEKDQATTGTMTATTPSLVARRPLPVSAVRTTPDSVRPGRRSGRAGTGLTPRGLRVEVAGRRTGGRLGLGPPAGTGLDQVVRPRPASGR